MLTIIIQPIGLFVEITLIYGDKKISYEVESVYTSDKFMISYITYHLSKLKS